MERMYTFAPRSTLRSRPSVDAEAILVVPPRTQVEVVEEQGSFCRVRYQDQDGLVTEGYLAKSLLQPSPLDESPSDGLVVPTAAGDQQQHFTVSPANATSTWLSVGMALLLVGNLASGIVLWRGMADLRSRSYHVSCSGSGYSVSIPSWGRDESYGHIDPDYYQDGQVRALIRYRVLEKLPGSKIVLRYRLEGEQVWNEQVMQERDEQPLLYSASFPVDPEAFVNYYVLQKQGGETLRADGIAYVNLANEVGSGDVHCYIFWDTKGSTELLFRQEQYPAINALQVERIVVSINQKTPLEFTLLSDEGEMRATFQEDGYRGMNITVYYRDGEERSLEVGLYPAQPRVIKR